MQRTDLYFPISVFKFPSTSDFPGKWWRWRGHRLNCLLCDVRTSVSSKDRSKTHGEVLLQGKYQFALTNTTLRSVALFPRFSLGCFSIFNFFPLFPQLECHTSFGAAYRSAGLVPFLGWISFLPLFCAFVLLACFIPYLTVLYYNVIQYIKVCFTALSSTVLCCIRMSYTLRYFSKFFSSMFVRPIQYFTT